MSILNGTGNKNSYHNNHCGNYQRYKMGQIGFTLPGDPVSLNEITQKYRNSNGFKNYGFKKDKNKVPGLDVLQLKKCDTKKYNSLQGKDAYISNYPVRN